MKVLSKAYSCSCSDFEGEDIFYGESSNKAKAKAFDSWDFIPYIEIKARRAKDLDLIKPNPSSLLNNLTESQVKKMKHMTGLSVGRNQYRNYYTSCSPVEDLEMLIPMGLAGRFNKFDSIVYYLTDKGLEVIKSTVPLTRKEVNNQANESIKKKT